VQENDQPFVGLRDIFRRSKEGQAELKKGGTVQEGWLAIFT